MEKFKYSNDNKRYHTFNYYLRNKYHCKVFKVSLNANFTCPNRDGLVGYGGCAFCSSKGSGDFAGDINQSLNEQFTTIKTRMHQKWPEAKYLAYFQAYTNTYAPLNQLKEIYSSIIKQPNLVGIAIATRPDCLNKEIIDYLNELSNTVDIWLELGLQTTYDETAQLFNRGYNYETFINNLKLLKDSNIKVCVHIINGLPNETKDMMLNNVKRLAKLNIDAIKIHMLHIVEDSAWGQNNYRYDLLSLEEYVDIVVQQLRYLPPEIIIQRLSGDADKNTLVAPLWTLNKTKVLNEIDKKMALHNYYQGDLYE